jgi:hypothetical protein
MARKRNKDSEPTERGNIGSELWAKAMADLESYDLVIDNRKFELKTARDRRKVMLKGYAEQGIPTTHLLRRQEEALLSEDERHQLFAIEQVSRRALSLWDAETADDFEQLIERAARTEPATGEGWDKLEGVRAYNDGFNGGAHGSLTADDNPHRPSDLRHAQWARGVADGIDYAHTFGDGSRPLAEVVPEARTAPPAPPASNGAQTTRGRGRPPKAAPVAETAAPASDTAPGLPPVDDFDMPVPPGLPH